MIDTGIVHQLDTEWYWSSCAILHARDFLGVEVIDTLVFSSLTAELETMTDLLEDVLDAIS
jgi:hypothetical protein